MEERTQRVGVRAPDFVGMIADADPRDLPRNAFQSIENMALERLGEASSRRGMRIRHTAPFTSNLIGTKRSHATFYAALANWLVVDVGNGSFRFLDATSAATTNQSFTPSPAWHSEPKICFAKTSGAELFAVNGIDRPWKHNGQIGSSINSEGPACPVGIDPPAAAPTCSMTTSGGAEAGTYVLAYRFVDRYGNPSVLSPVLEQAATAGQKFQWTFAASSGLDSSGRVTRRQLFRTLVDNADVYYLVAEIADNSTTTYDDTLSDDDLADPNRSGYARLPLVNPNGTLNANRFVVPPSHKKVVVWDQDRLWFMADGSYSTGTISGTGSGTTITGSGTTFTSRMIGWEIWPNATAKIPYTITAVGSATSITVSPAIDTTFSGVAYVARPARTERNTIYCSEPEEPESVPQSQNSCLVQFNPLDDDDEIVGGFSNRRGLFVFRNRSTYCIDYVRQGKLSAGANPVAERGGFNQACHVYIEGVDYLLDADGPWALGGDDATGVGDGFANYFREGLVDFTKSDTFFVAANRRTKTVRFYVVLTADGTSYPTFCFCYNYRLKRWWTERRPWQVSGAGLLREGSTYTYYELPVGGYPIVYDDGYACDGVSAAVRGMVSTWNGGTGELVASDSVFTEAMIGAPVVLTSGSGKRGLGLITAYSDGTTVTVATTLDDIGAPAAGDTFLVGGIPWSMKSAQYDIPEADGERVPIEIGVSFLPTSGQYESLEVRHYLSQRTAAEAAGAGAAEDGVMPELTLGSADATYSMYVDKSADAKTVGYVMKAIGGRSVGTLGGERQVTAEVRGIAGGERHVIRQIDVSGVS